MSCTLGRSGADAQFTDLVKHAASRQQTVTWASSVDPWASAADLDYSLGDQIGLDLFFTSGITRGLPAMVPIALIYANPEDAANQIAYLYKRHYPISWIEMGEEADGKHIEPEDYATLYLQLPRRFTSWCLRRSWGAGVRGNFEDVEFWPDANGDASFLRRFINYSKPAAGGRLHLFTASTIRSWACQRSGASVQGTGFVSHIIQVWRDNGRRRTSRSL
jgi:hypothetical protein